MTVELTVNARRHLEHPFHRANGEGSNRRQRRRGWRASGLATLCAALLSFSAGCPGGERFTIPENERRPNSAVETVPPTPVCQFEPHGAGDVPLTAEGGALASLVRWRDRILLVRVAAAGSDEPSTLEIAEVGRDGAVHVEGETRETGQPGAIRSLSTAPAGESLLVALTRIDGRVDVLRLSRDGAAEAPVTSLDSGTEGQVAALWFREAPVLLGGGRALRTEGPVENAESPGAGDAGAGDGGASPAAALPGEVEALVAAGSALGFVHEEGESLFLSHLTEGRADAIQTIEIGRSDAGPIHLLWVGDRYLVADHAMGWISRFSLASGRRAADGPPGGRLILGGRFTVPRPPEAVTRAAWDNAGPRHVGIVQAFGPRHLRFLNVALAGQILDAAIHVRTERDVVDVDVAWDGGAYTFLWAEAASGGQASLQVARVSCPDDES